MAARTSDEHPPASTEVRVTPRHDRVQPARTTGGAPAPAAPEVVDSRAAVPEWMGGGASAGLQPGVLYRVANGRSVRLRHPDGSDSYHPGGTLLRFTQPPAEFEGALEVAHTPEQDRALLDALPKDRRLPGKPADDPVEAFTHADVLFARYSLRALASRAASKAPAPQVGTYDDKALRPAAEPDYPTKRAATDKANAEAPEA